MLEFIKSHMNKYDIILTCFQQVCFGKSCLSTLLAEVEADVHLHF